MNKIYVISFERIIIAWSKKEKYIDKYIKYTLNNCKYINISNIDIDLSEINEIENCPFDTQLNKFTNDEIVKEFGFYLTKLEWDIIENEFEEYLYNLSVSFETVISIKNILSDKGKNYLKNIFKEFEQIKKKDFFKNYIINHPTLFNNNKIEERIRSRNFFLEQKELDKEYKRNILGRYYD